MYQMLLWREDNGDVSPTYNLKLILGHNNFIINIDHRHDQSRMFEFIIYINLLLLYRPIGKLFHIEHPIDHLIP